MTQVIVGLVCGLAVGAAYRWRLNIRLWLARRRARATERRLIEAFRDEEK